MKRLLNISALLILAFFVTACEQEILPQNGYATKDQVAEAPGAYANAVNAITSTLTGEFIYGGSNNYPYDLGWPALNLERDIMGQDIVYVYQNWYSYWYEMTYLGPAYRICQMPWTFYFKWIKSCNEVISMATDEEGNVAPDLAYGVGIAYAVRAWLYTEMAQMYSQKTYTVDKSSVSVPIVTESTALEDLAHNPRATHEQMFAFILSDLDKAETYLAGYKRPNLETPDLSVAYGLKARAYLLMGEWENARTYAKKAQAGYRILSADEYTDWENGFNNQNNPSWMFAVQYKTSDPQIQNNDADSSWGSMMYMEISPETSACGYAANYGQPFIIDRHLYDTMPASDIRKKCYVDFAIDDLSGDAKLAALSAYTKYPSWLVNSAAAVSGERKDKVGGFQLKFRTAGGDAGRANQYVGFVGAVPLMRVEEMYLIEAEAAGRLNESEGISLLTAFAKQRDPEFEYGNHTENYGSVPAGDFINEIWWQRRVELWGEGFATFDIKRLQKGVIRNYPNTNHISNYRFVEQTTPDWMNFCIVQTETNYNFDCTNNPDPSKASPADDPMVTSF